MAKALVFLLGLTTGGTAVLLTGEFVPINSAIVRALADRIEHIPVDKVCRSIASGKDSAGNNHIATWSDGERYLVAGWRVNKSEARVSYWMGADVPSDVLCNK